MENFKWVNRAALIFLVLLFAWTYFAKNNYRNVDDAHPDVLKEPVQKEAINQEPIEFSKDDYQYSLKPLYEFELNAMIVNRLDYRKFSISKKDSVFPMDLCVVWGDNVKSKVYQSKMLSFSQDFRMCFWRWFGNLEFNNNQAANVHLIIKEESLADKLKLLSSGDQVKVKGQLVNVSAKNTGQSDIGNSSAFNMRSSTIRNDTGPGACEIINVEDIEIIKKGNPLAFTLYRLSYPLLIILIILNIAWFLIKNYKAASADPEEHSGPLFQDHQ